MKRDKLVQMRKKLGLTQEQVSSKAGVKRSYYGLVENGVRNPSLENALKISAALDSKIEDLFVGEIFFNGRCYDTSQFLNLK